MSAAHPIFEQPEARYVPHNLDAEQALLGAILTNPQQVVPIVRSMVDTEEFFEPVHQRIYGLILDYDRKNMAPTPVLIAQALRQDPPIGSVSAAAYVGRLGIAATTVINAPDYARTVRSLAIARRAMQTAERLMDDMAGDSALDPYGSVTDAIADFDELLAVRDRSRRAEADLGEAIEQALEAAHHRRENKGRPEITTGLGSLDRILGGLAKGRLVVIGGRPAMGKTALMGALQVSTARAAHGSATFSYEMGHAELGMRAASLFASEYGDRLEYSDLSRGAFSDAQGREVEAIAQEAGRLPVRIIAASGMTVHDVASRARRIKGDMERRGQKLEVLFVDYLQRIAATNRYAGSRVQEIGEMSTALKSLAQQLGVCVVLLSQLSRAVEQRDDKRPRLSDLRESGDIEQDADQVLFLYRKAYYLGKKPDPSVEDQEKLDACRNVIEVHIAKNRHGPEGLVQLYGDMGTNVIRDLEQREVPA